MGYPRDIKYPPPPRVTGRPKKDLHAGESEVLSLIGTFRNIIFIFQVIDVMTRTDI